MTTQVALEIVRCFQDRMSHLDHNEQKLYDLAIKFLTEDKEPQPSVEK